MEEDYILINVTDLPVASSPDDLVVYGVDESTNKSVKIPFSFFHDDVGEEALSKAEDALAALENLPLKIEAVQFSDQDFPDIAG